MSAQTCTSESMPASNLAELRYRAGWYESRTATEREFPVARHTCAVKTHADQFELPSEIDGRVWDCGQHPGCLGDDAVRCAAITLPRARVFPTAVLPSHSNSPHLDPQLPDTHGKTNRILNVHVFTFSNIQMAYARGRPEGFGPGDQSELFVGRVGLGGSSSTTAPGAQSLPCSPSASCAATSQSRSLQTQLPHTPSMHSTLSASLSSHTQDSPSSCLPSLVPTDKDRIPSNPRPAPRMAR